MNIMQCNDGSVVIYYTAAQIDRLWRECREARKAMPIDSPMLDQLCKELPEPNEPKQMPRKILYLTCGFDNNGWGQSCAEGCDDHGLTDGEILQMHWDFCFGRDAGKVDYTECKPIDEYLIALKWFCVDAGYTHIKDPERGADIGGTTMSLKEYFR